MRKINEINMKRSQTNIIVTILLILIAIGAVALVGSFVYKFMRENAKFDNAKVDLSIDVSKGKPCYNPSLSLLMLSVKRGTDTSNLTGIRFIATVNGKTEITLMTNKINGFESLQYAIPVSAKPDSIEIAPLISIDGKEKLLAVIDKSDLINSTVCVITANTKMIPPPVVPIGDHGIN